MFGFGYDVLWQQEGSNLFGGREPASHWGVGVVPLPASRPLPVAGLRVGSLFIFDSRYVWWRSPDSNRWLQKSTFQLYILIS